MLASIHESTIRLEPISAVVGSLEKGGGFRGNRRFPGVLEAHIITIVSAIPQVYLLNRR
jgi:hypothetical protein